MVAGYAAPDRAGRGITQAHFWKNTLASERKILSKAREARLWGWPGRRYLCGIPATTKGKVALPFMELPAIRL